MIAVLVPTLAYLIGGLGFGTYTGLVRDDPRLYRRRRPVRVRHRSDHRLLQVLLGPPALFVSLAIFVVLNIPSLGATYTPEVLPGFWRFLNHFWIGAETINAERSILYFGGQDVGADLLRLLAWTGVIVVLLLVPVSRKLERRRERPARHIPASSPRLANHRPVLAPATATSGGSRVRTRCRVGRSTGRAMRLHGRRAECEFLDAVLADARDGRSRVVVLRGEAGAGKSVLLDFAAERADGWRVATAVGIESEMELAYSGLHQLCAPMLDHLDRLPAPQRDALRTVFGRQPGPPPTGSWSALATLTLLAEVAEQQPLLCVIDDAQWLDTASAQIVVFVGRRLLAERIALVCAARTGPDGEVLAGLPELRGARARRRRRARAAAGEPAGPVRRRGLRPDRHREPRQPARPARAAAHVERRGPRRRVRPARAPSASPARSSRATPRAWRRSRPRRSCSS